MPSLACPSCGYLLPGINASDLIPEPDDVLLCLACGELSIVTASDLGDGLLRRSATPEESAALAVDPDVIAAHEARSRLLG